VGGRSDAHWVDLALVGSPLNRFGVGSLVAVHSGQGVQVRELRGSLGYAGFTGANLHVGLGRAAVIDSVVVRWPGDATTTHLDVAADTRVELTAALAGRPAPTGPGRPEGPRLHVHPNPANSTFNIGLHLARAGHVCLTVHNALGQQVACLLDGVVGAGVRQVSWDGFNRQQRPAASGVYFLCLRTDRAVVTRRLVLLR